MKKTLLAALLTIALIACKKEANELQDGSAINITVSDSVSTVFVRAQVTDKDGTKTYSKVEFVKLK